MHVPWVTPSLRVLFDVWSTRAGTNGAEVNHVWGLKNVPDNKRQWAFQAAGHVIFHPHQHPVPYDPVTNTFDHRTVNLAKSDKGMKAGFDSHYISVAIREGFQAVDSPTKYDYDEVVLKEATQVLPVAAVHFCRVDTQSRP